VSENNEVPQGGELMLVQADPAEILKEITDLERFVQDAEAEVVVRKGELKKATAAYDSAVSALRAAVRKATADPMPLFTETIDDSNTEGNDSHSG
jgi:hypothetical protein